MNKKVMSGLLLVLIPLASLAYGQAWSLIYADPSTHKTAPPPLLGGSSTPILWGSGVAVFILGILLVISGMREEKEIRRLEPVEPPRYERLEPRRYERSEPTRYEAEEVPVKEAKEAPIDVLRLRLAKGEISMEEYEKLKKVLEK